MGFLAFLDEGLDCPWDKSEPASEESSLFPKALLTLARNGIVGASGQRLGRVRRPERRMRVDWSYSVTSRTIPDSSKEPCINEMRIEGEIGNGKETNEDWTFVDVMSDGSGRDDGKKAMIIYL